MKENKNVENDREKRKHEKMKKLTTELESRKNLLGISELKNIITEINFIKTCCLTHYI